MKTKTIILVLIAFVGCIMLAQDAPRGFRNPADVVMMTTTTTTSTNPFSPADVSGLQVWLKSESLSGSDGTAITQWSDSSGNNYHATNNAGNCPCITNNVFGTYEAAYFNGSSTNYLSFVSSALGILKNVGGVSIFLAIKSFGGTVNGKWIYFSTNTLPGATRLSFGYGAGGTTFQISARSPDTSSVSTSDTATLATNINITVSCHVAYTNDSCFSYTNNVLLINDTTFTTANNTDNSDSAEIVLGAIPGSAYAKFYLGEFIMYNRQVTATERTNIFNYMTNKFSITP